MHTFKAVDFNDNPNELHTLKGLSISLKSINLA